MYIHHKSQSLSPAEFDMICKYMEGIIAVGKSNTHLQKLASNEIGKDDVFSNVPSVSFYDISQEIDIFIVDADNEQNSKDTGNNHLRATPSIIVVDNIIRFPDECSKKEYPECIDLLGVYTYYSLQEKDKPHILLFADRILKAERSELKRKWLFTKVLIHELMHALMDVKSFCTKTCKSSQVDYAAPFGRCNEELFANALTAYYIAHHDKPRMLKYALDFMTTQSFEYKKGGEYYEEFQDNIIKLVTRYVGQKRKGCLPSYQKEWCKAIALRPVSEMVGLENARWDGGFVEYNGEYYNALNAFSEDSGRLVAKLLKEWVKCNGGNMSSRKAVEEIVELKYSLCGVDFDILKERNNHEWPDVLQHKSSDFKVEFKDGDKEVTHWWLLDHVKAIVCKLPAAAKAKVTICS